jgi:hypothetical protein
MDEELQNRIRRIYAAIGDTVEYDVSKFQPQTGGSGSAVFIVQDFRGGLSGEQISNIAHSAIHNVASLEHHLQRWLGRTGRSLNVVKEAVEKSFELQVVIDLWNVDKHGYPPRNNRSGRAPKLREVKRVMQMSSGPQPNSGASIWLSPTPGVQFIGSGSAAVIITGTIVDKKGLVLGSLDKFLGSAVAAWERLLQEVRSG